MSDLRKAAEMALEALETLWDILDDIDTASDMAKENDAWYRKRVEVLQKKRWDTTITTDGYKLKGGPVEALRQALAQPEQEPVAWMWKDGTLTNDQDRADGTWQPLYTAPPKREWVGLDEVDIYEAMDFDDEFDFAEAIEDKLKEKNT